MTCCNYCNNTGWIACRSRDGTYAFAGPVPDDAKGYFDADCWHCDSGRYTNEKEKEYDDGFDEIQHRPKSLLGAV